MEMALKIIFFSLVFFLLFDGYVLNYDKRLKRAVGQETQVDFKRGIGLFGSKFSRYFNREEIDTRLAKAGFPWGLTVDSFIGLKITLSILMVLAQLYLRSGLLYLIVVTIVAFFLPDIFLFLVTNDRQNAIKKELPDVIDIFKSTISSGIDVGLSFGLAAGYVKGKELKKELSLMAAKYSVTKDKEEALLDFKRNTDMYETDLLVLALLQDSKTGKAQNMLESLSQEHANKAVAAIELNGKAIEYKVLFVCFIMAISIVLIIAYPYFINLSSGLTNIFN